LRKAVACSEDELREAQALIRSLNPRPGAQYSPAETRYVIADVIVRKVRGQWTASLNAEAMPRLRINRLYADILQGQRGSGLASQLQEAKWLIKNVQQRFETIQRVSQAIVDRQRQFFEHGEVAMRPLTLREIADQLGLHESTISRVTTQKYMATPRGVLRIEILLRQPRRHRCRRRGLLDRHPGADQAAGRRRGRQEAPLRRPARRNPRPAGHRGGAAHRRQVPRGAEHPAGQP
jgi:RNA polymerase sigma-54 factor